MTREDKKKLESILAPLRSLVGRKEFMELAMVYIQQYQGYVAYGIDRDSIADSLCVSCYDIRYPGKKGFVVITAREDLEEVKRQMASRTGYDWSRCFAYGEDMDDLLAWIQRDGDELQEKYQSFTEKIRKDLSFLHDRVYGWWEAEPFEHAPLPGTGKEEA